LSIGLPTRGELYSAGVETGRIVGVQLPCRSWAKLDLASPDPERGQAKI
jgi:hypothetical protein